MAEVEANVTYAHNLMEKLLEGYLTDEPPMRFLDDHVDVAIALKLTKLLELNQVERTVTVAGWLRQFWYDPRLKFDGKKMDSHWNQREDFLQMDTSKIWVPDTTLINAVDFNWGEACDLSVKSFVYSEGSRFVSASNNLDLTKDESQASEFPMPFNVMLLRPCVFKAKCDVDLSYYPFDQFFCPFTFQPWGDKFMKLHIAADAITSLVNLPEFAVRMFNASTGENYYKTSGAAWPQMVVNVQIARHGHYYVVNVICPILLIVLLTWFAFWVPMRETDRVSYMMTLVLTVMAIMAINAEKRPATDGNMWLDEFQMITMLLVVLSALYTIWILRIRPPDEPTQEWSQEAINARLMLIEYVERIARIVFPVLVFLALGFEFLDLELYEQTGPRLEKNFSGKATIWVFVFIAFIFIFKLADILYTWFPEYMPDAKSKVRDWEEHAHATNSQLDMRRKLAQSSRSSEPLPNAMYNSRMQGDDENLETGIPGGGLGTFGSQRGGFSSFQRGVYSGAGAGGPPVTLPPSERPGSFNAGSYGGPAPSPGGPLGGGGIYGGMGPPPGGGGSY